MSKYFDIENPYKVEETGWTTAKSGICPPKHIGTNNTSRWRPLRILIVVIVAFGLVSVFIFTMIYERRRQKHSFSLEEEVRDVNPDSKGPKSECNICFIIVH